MGLGHVFPCKVFMNDGTKKDVYMPITGGLGMFWEADEAARCLSDGRKESKTMSWEASVLIMEALDDVRRQNGLQVPEAIESIEYNK
jgi:hypothetical protein